MSSRRKTAGRLSRSLEERGVNGVRQIAAVLVTSADLGVKQNWASRAALENDYCTPPPGALNPSLQQEARGRAPTEVRSGYVSCTVNK